MSKRRPQFVTDTRYDRLDELQRRVDALWENGDIADDSPATKALLAEYDQAKAEVFPRDVFDEIAAEAEEDEDLMGRVETLIAERPDLREMFKGGSRERRALELESNQDLRTTILNELKGNEE